eukprot:6194562-Pleurochrysis_carterae.AAC.4
MNRLARAWALFLTKASLHIGYVEAKFYITSKGDSRYAFAKAKWHLGVAAGILGTSSSTNLAVENPWSLLLSLWLYTRGWTRTTSASP